MHSIVLYMVLYGMYSIIVYYLLLYHYNLNYYLLNMKYLRFYDLCTQVKTIQVLYKKAKVF